MTPPQAVVKPCPITIQSQLNLIQFSIRTTPRHCMLCLKIVVYTLNNAKKRK